MKITFADSFGRPLSDAELAALEAAIRGVRDEIDAYAEKCKAHLRAKAAQG